MMSRKPPSRFSASTEEVNSKLIGDYSTVLKEKSRLESENAILKFQIENQKENINKLTAELNNVKSELETYTALKNNAENDVQKQKNELKKMEEAYTALVIQNDASRKQLKQKVVELTQELIKKDENLLKSHDNVLSLKCKNNKYKEKIEMALAVIRNGNWDHLNKRFCDKGIQTCSESLENSANDDFIRHCEEQMLSDLFFKGNPFTDGNESI